MAIDLYKLEHFVFQVASECPEVERGGEGSLRQLHAAGLWKQRTTYCERQGADGEGDGHDGQENEVVRLLRHRSPFSSPARPRATQATAG